MTVLAFMLLALLPGRTHGAETTFADETLHYVISYKWGLVHKEAGDATLSLRKTGDRYRLTLTARTRPWADKFFAVRDTLVSTVSRVGFKPVQYSKIAHEGGRYSRDDLDFSILSSNVKCGVKRVKIDKKGKRTESSKSLSATGRSFDMLSVFYYLRTLDFASLSGGRPVTVNIFSGSKVEKLTIRCVGKDMVKQRDGAKQEAWHLKFRFTQEGGKKSSDDIDAWITADSRHIPLQLVGSLPVGQVRCTLK